MGIDDMVAKAKAALPDERVDQVAEAARKVTDDKTDATVDKVAEQAKRFND
jgi:hypothetical protein